jgi:hypothetical protein
VHVCALTSKHSSASAAINDWQHLPLPWRDSGGYDTIDPDLFRHHHGIRDGRYPAGVSLGMHDGHAGLIGIHRAKKDFSADEIA